MPGRHPIKTQSWAFGSVGGDSNYHPLADFDTDGDVDAADEFAFDVILAANMSCDADIDTKGVFNIDDIDAFSAALIAGELAADMNCDGILNFDDIDAFATAVMAGC